MADGEHIGVFTRHDAKSIKMTWDIDKIKRSTVPSGGCLVSPRLLNYEGNEGVKILLYTNYKSSGYVSICAKSYYKDTVYVEFNGSIENKNGKISIRDYGYNVYSKEVDKEDFSTCSFLKYEGTVGVNELCFTSSLGDNFVIDIEVQVSKPSTKTLALGMSFAKGKTLHEDFGNLLESRDFTDVKVIVGAGQDTKDFQLHKLVLAARSPVFAAMFRTDMTESRNNEVRLEDVEPELMDLLVRYIYTGSTEGVEKMAEKMLPIADKYQLDGLKSYCGREIAANLRVENAVAAFQLAELYGLADLKEYVLSFMSRNASKLTKGESWKSLGSTNPEVFIELSKILLEKLTC